MPFTTPKEIFAAFRPRVCRLHAGIGRQGPQSQLIPHCSEQDLELGVLPAEAGCCPSAHQILVLLG